MPRGCVSDERSSTDSVGRKDAPSNPNAEAATSTPAEDADPVSALEKLRPGIGSTVRDDHGTEVYLQNTKFTDAGLVHLKGLTNLQELNLRYTKFTDVGIAELQQALPN